MNCPPHLRGQFTNSLPLDFTPIISLGALALAFPSSGPSEFFQCRTSFSKKFYKLVFPHFFLFPVFFYPFWTGSLATPWLAP